MRSMDIIIYGASGGIGQFLVKHLKNSHKLYGTYFHHDPHMLESGCEYFKVDVSDRERMKIFTSDIASRLSNPVLIYAPGVSLNNVTQSCQDQDWDKTISVNLTGAMLACRGILPRMKESRFGRIILLSSVLSRISVPGTIAYSATKSALCAMARVMAIENAQQGITVNALALGYHYIGIIKDVPESYLHRHVLSCIPEGKLGNPMNIVNGVSFLYRLPM